MLRFCRYKFPSVGQGHGIGVKKLAHLFKVFSKPLLFPRFSVFRIEHHRMPDVGQVCPDLMRASCEKVHGKQRETVVCHKRRNAGFHRLIIF